MKQTFKNTAAEIRYKKGGRLAAKYYRAKGVIEIRDGDNVVQFGVPPWTELHMITGILLAAE